LNNKYVITLKDRAIATSTESTDEWNFNKVTHPTAFAAYYQSIAYGEQEILAGSLGSRFFSECPEEFSTSSQTWEFDFEHQGYFYKREFSEETETFYLNRTIDRGENWTQLSFEGTSYLLYPYSSEDRLFIWNGEFMQYSDDAGDTWNSFFDELIILSYANADTLVGVQEIEGQDFQYNIFSSFDFGNTYENNYYGTIYEDDKLKYHNGKIIRFSYQEIGENNGMYCDKSYDFGATWTELEFVLSNTAFVFHNKNTLALSNAFLGFDMVSYNEFTILSNDMGESWIRVKNPPFISNFSRDGDFLPRCLLNLPEEFLANEKYLYAFSDNGIWKVRRDFLPNPSNTTADYVYNLNQGESVEIAGEQQNEPGFYQEILTDIFDCDSIVTHQIILTSAVQDLVIETKTLNVSPNPFNNTFTLSTENLNEKIQSWALFNVNGEIISSSSNLTPTNQITIQQNNLLKGVYLLKSVVNEQVVFNKLIKA
jgi:hypothetical protein